MSALDWTAHDAELLAANLAARELEPGSRRPLHPARCGPCADCREYLELGRALDVPSSWASPYLGAFLEHARRFGPELVAETAAAYLDEPELDRLRVELDELERERRRGRFTVGRRRRRSEAESARYARALAEELAEQGLGRLALEHRIADKLGVSDAYARRLLKLTDSRLPTAEIAPLNPSVQAAESATKQESDTALPPRVKTA